MAIISLSGAFSDPKRRPKPYRARDAAYTVGGNRGYYVAALPRPYPLTPQQRKVKEVAQRCGITADQVQGKADLQRKMKECVGPAMRRGG